MRRARREVADPSHILKEELSGFARALDMGGEEMREIRDVTQI